MERLLKRLSAAVIALAVFAAAFVFDVPEKITAEAEETHTNHKVCGDLNCTDHGDVTWIPWTSSTSLPTSGNYYLTKDVTVTKETNFPSGLLNICLNGHTITATNNSRIFYIKAGIFTLCDCKKSGKLTGGNPGDGEDGGAIYVYNACLDLYDVTISGNTAKRGGAIYRNSGFVTLCGGTISGNTATDNGGGIYGKYFSIDGKVNITGNTVNDSPNNVCISNSGTITIEDNFSTESAIGISVAQPLQCSKEITDAFDSDISDCFTPDISGQKIKYENDKVWLYVDHISNTSWTTDGDKHWHTCQNCTEPTDEADHTGGTATCKQKAVCEVCGAAYGDFGEHDYGDWSITTPPTTTTEGTAERVCSNDSTHKETETLPALTNSTWTKKTENKNPTLTETGSYTYESTDYGTVTVTVPKLIDAPWIKDTEHSKEPTEEQAGEYVYTSAYGTVTVTIPSLSHTHTMTHVPEVPATEEEDGVKEHWYCSGCKKDFLDENGEHEATANDLKLTYNHTHTLTHVDEVPATEEEDGVKEHWHCGGCGKDFADEDGETELSELELTIPKLGKLEIDVEKSETAPATELKTTPDDLKETVLSDEDIENIDSKDIKIVLKVEDATNKVSDEDKAAVGTAIGSLTLGQYLNIDLFKIIDEAEEKVTETSAPLTITFTIPAELRGSGRTFSVIRVHEGTTTVLEDKDSDPNTVTIETDKFSTYALAYSAAQTSPSGESEGGSGGTAVTPVDPVPPESKPNGSDGATPSESAPQSGSSSASDQSTANSDNSAASSGENTPASGEGSQSDNKGNPSTGVAVSLSLIPFITALALFTIAFKRVK